MRAAQRAADGLLRLGHAGARGAAARDRCSAPTSTRARSTCTTDGAAVRIGLGYVSGVRADEVAALVQARAAGGPFRSLGDLASRAGAGRPALAQLAWAGACDSLRGGHTSRREILWELGIAAPGEPVRDGTQLSLPLDVPGAPELRELEPWEAMIADYATTGLTLGSHPMALLRPQLPAGTVSCRDLEALGHDARVRIGGLVVARQRPGTAKGIVFILIETAFIRESH